MLLLVFTRKDITLLKYLLSGLSCLAYIGLVPSGHAGVFGEYVKPYVGYSITYDDNLFRLSDDIDEQAVYGINQRSDQIQAATIGLEVDLPISQQRLLLELENTRYRYDNFSLLDNTGKHYLGKFDWLYGSRLTGNIGASYDKQLNSFENFFIIRKDLITRRRVFADVDYLINNDWTIRGAYRSLDSEHSVSERERSNLNTDKYTLDLLRKSWQNNYLGVKFELLDGKYPDRVRTAISDDQFVQYTGRALALWKASAISIFNAELGYTDRQWKHISSKNFSTPTGLLEYKYKYSNQFQGKISLERDVRSIENRNGSFSLDDSIGLNLNWFYSEKINIQANFEYVDINYKGEAGNTILDEKRNDKDHIVGLIVNYTPFNNTLLSLGYNYKKRTSNLIFADFNDSIYEFDVRVAF